MSAEVEKLLNDKGISFKVSGQDYVVACLNPEHEDNNPSLRIDKIRGIGHCLSCGFKVNIFNHFNVIVNKVSMRTESLRLKLKELKANSEGLPMLEGAYDARTAFRGISVSTYKEFGAFYTDVDTAFENRIVFPVNDISGKTRVFVGRHVLSNGNPRYMIQPSGAKMQMLPPKLLTKSNYLVLVEGVFDMLNLYDKGLKAVSATMGTKVLSEKELPAKLLPFRAQGVTKIYILFDGDEAGVKAADELKPALEKLEYLVEIIPLESDMDPGNLSEEDVLSIKEYCENQMKQI